MSTKEKSKVELDADAPPGIEGPGFFNPVKEAHL